MIQLDSKFVACFLPTCSTTSSLEKPQGSIHSATGADPEGGGGEQGARASLLPSTQYFTYTSEYSNRAVTQIKQLLTVI